MVVRLDLERDRLAVSDVDYARVLARALEDGFTLGWEAAEEESRVLVAAVLRPEEGEDRELEVVRIALEQRADAVVLSVRQAERAVERCRGDGTQIDDGNNADGRLRRGPKRSR